MIRPGIPVLQDGEEVKASRDRDRHVLLVSAEDGGYRAEVWVRPYNGFCLATTRMVATRAWAVRDGRRLLRFDDDWTGD